MTDPTQKRPESSGQSHENSYVESDEPAEAPDAPDIQQPGPAGDFGNASTNERAGKSRSAELPSKRSSGRTPGDQPELARQADDGTAERPGDAAEPENTYSGT